jgi:plastocyanin
VKIDNFTFNPDTLTVPVNSTVTWVNKDDIPPRHRQQRRPL